MRRIWPALLLTLMLAAVAHAQEQDDTYFVHNDPNYWWYVSQHPPFELALPSRGERYTTNDVLGERIVTVELNVGGPLIRVGAVPLGSSSGPSVREALIDRYAHLFSRSDVLNDDPITTSNGLQAHFYAVQGRTPSGEEGMLRFVFFTENDRLAWLVFLAEASAYAGNVRTYWLEAVNSFAWR